MWSMNNMHRSWLTVGCYLWGGGGGVPTTVVVYLLHDFLNPIPRMYIKCAGAIFMSSTILSLRF